MSNNRPNLLFVAPVMPAPTGNGLAMRTGMVLDALARAYAVHLLVVPVAGATEPGRIPPFVRARTAAVAVDALERAAEPLALALAGSTDDPRKRGLLLLAWPRPLLCRFATPERIARLAALWPGRRFDLVHVMRLYMAPYAAPYLDHAAHPGRAAAGAVLDLDDDEVRTRARIAALHERNGDPTAARLEAREAERYAALERGWLARFDRVLVCSENDRAALALRTEPRRIAVVPNAVPLPDAAVEYDAGRSCSTTLLFVGSLDYFPNQDAVRFFVRAALPALRARAGMRLRLRVVGGGSGAALADVARLPGVEIVGFVSDLGREYRSAALVVVPVRAGGGTRIKLLEALAWAKPVVSTAVGAEGIEVEDGRHLLLADAPEDFAAACSRLLGEPEMARRVGANGRELVRTRYAPTAVGADLVRFYDSLYRGEVARDGAP